MSSPKKAVPGQPFAVVISEEDTRLFRHPNIHQAREEARRLALVSAQRGTKYYVLAVVAVAEPPRMPEAYVLELNTPFMDDVSANDLPAKAWDPGPVQGT